MSRLPVTSPKYPLFMEFGHRSFTRLLLDLVENVEKYHLQREEVAEIQLFPTHNLFKCRIFTFEKIDYRERE